MLPAMKALMLVLAVDLVWCGKKKMQPQSHPNLRRWVMNQIHVRVND